MERSTSIDIKLEGGTPFELSSPTTDRKSAEDKIYELAQNGYTCSVDIPCLKMEYQVRVPAFGKSHILVRTQDSVESMAVYGVKCEEGVQMSCDQIVNRVKEIFGVDVSENITANNTPQNANTLSNGETLYTCGTLFTSGPPCSTSSSLDTPPSSQLPATPPPSPRSVTPPPSQRPDRLRLTTGGTLPMTTPTLITPRPVATPNTTLPQHAIVACNGSFNMPGEPCKEAFDDSVQAFVEGGVPMHREGMVKVPTLVQQMLGPAQKVQGGNAELTNQLGVVALDTPEQNTTFQELVRPKVQIIVQNDDIDDSAANESPPISQCVETSSQESEQCLSSHPERGTSLVTSSFDKKSFGNQLVVGIGIGQPRRKLSMNSQEPVLNKPASLSRQLSLPGKKTAARTSTLQRNASDDCLERLEVKAQHDHSASDLQLQLTEQSEKIDHSPATPTKPLAVERQDSVASPELVMVKNRTVSFHEDKHQINNEKESVIMSSSDLGQSVEAPLEDGPPLPTTVPLLPTTAPLLPTAVPPLPTAVPPLPPLPTAVPPLPTAFPPLTKDSLSTPSESPVSPTESSLTTPPSSATDQPPSDFMLQVHLLEHAMNGYCRDQSDCSLLSRECSEFPQGVEQMRSLVAQAASSQGGVDEHVKSIIREHCRHCRDKECKVPHRMAGCLPPGEWYSETEHTDSPTQFTPSSSRPETAHIVSVDLQPANQSTSSDVRKHETEALQPSDDLPDNGHDQTAPFTPVDWRECGRPPRTVPNGQYYATSPPALKRRLPPDQHNDCGSPVGSEGFEMPGPAGAPVGMGQQYQESQLPAASYLHQVTNKARPRERRLYQYIEPSRSGGSLRKMYGGAEARVKGTKAGEFPSYSSLPRKPGTIIYSLKENVLLPGEVYPCPHNVHSERDRLGKGGNGTVVKFPLGGTEYALKQTTYRENELNIWSKLSHRNILPLLGVMLGEQQRDCFQFMPKMTGDLRSMLFDQGDLVSLLQKHPEQWELVMSNIVYILEEVLNGLVYLESQNVQHSDLKANNILILKTCSCPDILHCQCSKGTKYEVKLADFDSLKKTAFKRSAAQFVKLCSDSLMNEIDRNNVKGTPAYRAPEQFLSASSRGDYKKVLQDGKVQHDLEGPWCDVWSLGVVVLQMVLGSHSKGPYINEASLLASCKTDKMQPRIEASVATIRLVQLQDLSSHVHPELKPFAKLARECLKIDCRIRPTAKELLGLLQVHTAKPIY